MSPITNLLITRRYVKQGGPYSSNYIIKLNIHVSLSTYLLKCIRIKLKNIKKIALENKYKDLFYICSIPFDPSSLLVNARKVVAESFKQCPSIHIRQLSFVRVYVCAKFLANSFWKYWLLRHSKRGSNNT